MGSETLKVPMSLFSLNRQRLVKSLSDNPEIPNTGAVLLLEGGKQETRYCTPMEPVFRQVRLQYYVHTLLKLSGVVLPLVVWSSGS